jgi:hypothetical protein
MPGKPKRHSIKNTKKPRVFRDAHIVSEKVFWSKAVSGDSKIQKVFLETQHGCRNLSGNGYGLPTVFPKGYQFPRKHLFLECTGII